MGSARNRRRERRRGGDVAAAATAPAATEAGGGRRVFGLPILLLLGLYALLYASTLDSYGMFMWDEAEYASIGRSVLRGEGFSISGRPNPLRPPVPTLSSALAMAAFGETDVVAKLPVLVFSLLCLLTVYLFVRWARDRTAGLAAAGLLGMMPTFWQFTAYLLAEIPFMLFYTGAVVLLYFGLLRDERCLYASWACFGLALLSRYTALLFGPTAVCVFVIAWIMDRAVVMGRLRSRAFWLGPLVGAAVLAPWFLREQLTFGNALIGIKISSRQVHQYTVATMPWSYYFTALPAMVSWPVAVLAALGIGHSVRRCRGLGLVCAAAGAVIIGWMMQYDYKTDRLITGVLPFVAILGSIGLIGVVTPLLRRRFSARSTGIVVGCALLVSFALCFRAARDHLGSFGALGYPVFTEAMQHVKQSTPKDARLLGANTPQIFWYADRHCGAIPGKRERFAERLRDADWVVFTNFERGQPAYAVELAKRVTREEYQSGNARLFKNRRYATMVVRAEVVRRLLATP